MLDIVGGQPVFFSELLEIPAAATLKRYVIDESPPVGIAMDAYAVMRGYNQADWFLLWAINAQQVPDALSIPEGAVLYLPPADVLAEARRTGDMREL